MAHENLKFNLSLNRLNEWQPILGAQEYKTFFMVYVCFYSIDEDFVNDFGKQVCRYSCKFRIQNFRGEVTLGFADNPVFEVRPDGTISSPDDMWGNSDEIQTRFRIPLKAFHHNEKTDIIDFDFDKRVDRTNLLMTFYSVMLPEGMYNDAKPMQSDYLSPYIYERDGDGAFELGRRELGSKDEFKPYPRGFGGGEFGICSPNTSRFV